MMALLFVLIFIGTFTVALITVIVVVSVQRRRQPIEEPAQAENPFLLQSTQATSVPGWQKILERFDWTTLLAREMEQAGMRPTVGRQTLAMLLLGIIGFALFFGVSWTPPGASIAAALAFGAIPYWYVHQKRSRRLAAMETQFPDALDSLARALRAGHSLVQAVAVVSADTPAPLGPELRRLADGQSLGAGWAPALALFQARIPLLQAKFLSTTILLQARTGGKLSEVMEKLAETMRESCALRGEVQALSAHGRLTGVALSVLPAAIAVVMFFTNPSYILTLFSHTTGRLLLWSACACLLVGHLLIQRIVKVRAPQ